MPDDERSALLHPRNSIRSVRDHTFGIIEEARSASQSHISKEEAALASSSLGERLPYNDYTTIDWMHDLVRSRGKS